MHPHHGGHHGGHIPPSAFSNWGWWGCPQQYETVYVEEIQPPVSTWVCVTGGALTGALLALLSRGR
jgi:hypothetical protein